DAPLAIAIEDLQWADGDTLRTLTALGDGAVPPGVLLIATGCDGEWSAGGAGRLAFRAAWTRTPPIALGPLTVDQIAACLDARYGPRRPPSIAPLIHTATAGNAALVAALLDGLDARGLSTSGLWRRGAREPIASWLVAILRAFIIRQLDQLDADEARVLEAAAAVGGEFTAADVGSILAESVEEARAILRTLARRGHVIAVAAAPAREWRAEERYRFRLPLYADLVAERAPQLRQQQLAQRASRLARHARAK
ncbi:MAG TPA: hypothetical protein VFJ02_01985, partial [Vicinamibacterales bacterium]|nr:hypothetical protein [Vicinamibacterales bacterium]